jgi:hypothetical protein
VGNALLICGENGESGCKIRLLTFVHVFPSWGNFKRNDDVFLSHFCRLEHRARLSGCWLDLALRLAGDNDGDDEEDEVGLTWALRRLLHCLCLALYANGLASLSSSSSPCGSCSLRVAYSSSSSCLSPPPPPPI